MAEPSAEVLSRAAAAALLDARAAWKLARDTPDETRIRAALRQCVLAARLTRRAAGAAPHADRLRMLEEAGRIEATANDLKARLARIVEGATTPPT